MRILVAAAAVGLALGGCSSSDNSEPTADPSPSATEIASPTASSPASSSPPAEAAPEDALLEAYDTYVHAFLTGDGATAYSLLSERCRDNQPLSEFASLSEAAADLYGDVDYTVNSIDVKGDHGSVDTEWPVEALNQGGGSLWVLEDGEWHTDKCD